MVKVEESLSKTATSGGSTSVNTSLTTIPPTPATHTSTELAASNFPVDQVFHTDVTPYQMTGADVQRKFGSPATINLTTIHVMIGRTPE